jgi:hypothetical protein
LPVAPSMFLAVLAQEIGSPSTKGSSSRLGPNSNSSYSAVTPSSSASPVPLNRARSHSLGTSG